MRRLIRFWRMGGRDLRLLAQALGQRNRPRWLIPATVLLAFFALEPLNFAIPFVGVIDDFILLPLLLRALLYFVGIHRGTAGTPPAASATQTRRLPVGTV